MRTQIKCIPAWMEAPFVVCIPTRRVCNFVNFLSFCFKVDKYSTLNLNKLNITELLPLVYAVKFILCHTNYNSAKERVCFEDHDSSGIHESVYASMWMFIQG